MINFNGDLVQNSNQSIEKNRGFLFGDAVFETLKVLDNKILFLEDHYFRLMASMRVLRMEIPMDFTMEYMEEQILKTISCFDSNAISFRVRVTFFRDSEGLYLPLDNKSTKFLIQVSPLENAIYINNSNEYEIEIYKDFYVTKQLLSSLKTTNKLINVTASIFAEENGYQNCLLVNNEKNIVEAINSNIFIVNGKTIKTPPISDGCVNGIIRKQIIELISKSDEFTLEEVSISPFELQKADEIFLTNIISGIQSVSKYKKKEYVSEIANQLLIKLNAKIRLS
ncbi:aminotransferase class IV [Paenimyroides tangerinum]|uniref:branched-chain-amino-acid transaminase n=1 Tax=Paenimyroides tangerinum TaxID=2488728 RepID=A0A3P3W0Y0_9FLAO|nr:aminotransferase class IV [Paenimyroides tangerinum]RRJ88444.1 aminotransferase class IV [Paenimyroides tangerinum]